MYEGEVKLEFIFASDNISRIDTKQCVLPLNFSVDVPDLEQGCNINTDIDIIRDDFVIDGRGGVNSNIDLEFNIDISKTVAINVIDQIEVDETRQKEICSMIIYFVKPGDSLWKIAKKFKSTVEDIARVNNIEDVDKIYPGQQLFIPRYVYRNERSA